MIEQLTQHFDARLRAQALRIFGSVDVLGNPLGLMSDISSGICDLADMDFSGLVRNVAHGVGDSTAKACPLPYPVVALRDLIVLKESFAHNFRRKRYLFHGLV